MSINFFSCENTVEKTLNILKNSAFSFYLTGSRYFETSNGSSDYDFFVEKSEEVEKFLIDNGFSMLNNTLYLDSNTIKVYRIQLDWTWIDILLVKSTLTKISVQKIIKETNAFEIISLPKKKKHLIWDLVYFAYSQGFTNGKLSNFNLVPSEKNPEDLLGLPFNSVD